MVSAVLRGCLFNTLLQLIQAPVSLFRAYPILKLQATQEMVFGDHMVRVGQSQIVLGTFDPLGLVARAGHFLHFLVYLLKKKSEHPTKPQVSTVALVQASHFLVVLFQRYPSRHIQTPLVILLFAGSTLTTSAQVIQVDLVLTHQKSAQVSIKHSVSVVAFPQVLQVKLSLKKKKPALQIQPPLIMVG